MLSVVATVRVKKNSTKPPWYRAIAADSLSSLAGGWRATARAELATFGGSSSASQDLCPSIRQPAAGVTRGRTLAPILQFLLPTNLNLKSTLAIKIIQFNIYIHFEIQGSFIQTFQLISLI